MENSTVTGRCNLCLFNSPDAYIHNIVGKHCSSVNHFKPIFKTLNFVQLSRGIYEAMSCNGGVHAHLPCFYQAFKRW